jgi:microcystin-dependent protein
MSFAVNVNPDITDGITYYLKTKSLDRSTTNIGDLKWSVVNRDSHGWLLCDGRLLSRTQYRELFDVIGTSFGQDAPEDSFFLPDCRSRVLGAIGQGNGLSNRTLGEQTGEENHTLTINEMPFHNHGGITSTNGTHSHTGTTSTNGTHSHTGTTSTDGSHTHTTNANGGQGGLGLVTANNQNTVTDADASLGELNVWTVPYALTINNSGDHSHTLNVNNNGDHSHTLNVNNNGDHSHSISSQGGGMAYNNMQPTLFIGNVLIFGGYQYNP